MIKTLYYSISKHLPVTKPLLFRCESIYYNTLYKNYPSHDEWGECSICGKFSRFRYREYINRESRIAKSCGWDERFIFEINTANTLECSFCWSKFRIRCAAQSLLQSIWKGRFKSIHELVHYTNKSGEEWMILETSSKYGVLTDYELSNITKTEYYDDVDSGNYKDGVRAEDLQALTFLDNSFDAVVISLDVFEHIPNPWKAFTEVRRVLKPNGVGIITFPLDSRNQHTKTVVEIEDNVIKFLRDPMYHDDPLRPEGALVFTEFGMDIESKLAEKGFNVSLDVYATKNNTKQYVLLIKK